MIVTLVSVLALAQGAPGTDVFLIPFSSSGTTGAPVNITARPGYDNQPLFSPDGAFIYYTSQRDGNTDIWRYDVRQRDVMRVTTTPENEYSATVMPDGRHFSVIRDSTQHLWSFTLDGAPVRALLDSIRPVGYHTWLNADTVFVFVLGQPNTLRRAELARGTSTILARNIGRALLTVPGRRAISYAQRDSSGLFVRVIDPVSGEGETLVKLPANNEYFTWLPDGSLLSASGNRLLRWRRGDADWTEVASFSEPGLQQLSRLAVSPRGDLLALVGNEPRP